MAKITPPARPGPLSSQGSLDQKKNSLFFLAQYRKGVVWVSEAEGESDKATPLLLFPNVTERQAVLPQIWLPGCETIH